MNKLKTAVLGTLSLGSLIPLTAFTQTVDEAHALFAKYVQVINAGDKNGLRALIAENVERSNYRGCTPALNNRDCLITYITDTVINRHGQIKATDSFGVDGDTLYAGLELRSDGIRTAGAERAMGIDMVKFKNNQIVGLKFLPNYQDAQTKKYFDYVRITNVPSAQPVNR